MRNHLSDHIDVKRFIVVYRDPVERWMGCMAEHLSMQIEHGVAASDVLAFAQSRAWCDSFYTDMHLFSQSSYSQGVDINRSTFFWLDAGLTPVYNSIGVQAPELKLNMAGKHDRNHRGEIRRIITSAYRSDITVRNHVQDLYTSDWELFDQLYIQGRKVPLMV